MGNVPDNFHGKKGRSGRKKAYEESNKVKAINNLWRKIRRKVDEGKELSEYEEKLVLALLPKTIKTDVDVTSGGKPIYFPSELIDKYDNTSRSPEDNSSEQ